MKKTLIVAVLCLLLIPYGAVEAAPTISVDNYFMAHANKPGNYYLKNKSGSDQQWGDALELDADIKSLTISAQGYGKGDQIKIVYSDDTAQYVTPGSVMVDKDHAKMIKIVLMKTTNTEILVKVTSLTTYDPSANGDVFFTLDKEPSSKYGDLGNSGGSTDPDPGGGTPTTGGVDFQWNNGTRRITWTKYPAGTYEIIVTDPNGTKYNIVPTTKVFKVDDTGGVYKLEAKDLNGKVLYSKTMNIPAAGGTDPDPGGGTDPNPGGDNPDPGGDTPGTGGDTGQCGPECERLKQALECPEFDQYLGKWGDMIRTTFPPPPDWGYVSDVMRDKIVPAMGQEIVNRSPEVARIIADEFERREKPVSPPPEVPDYMPDVPRFQDVPAARGDLDKNVPSFQPDYTADKPFNILDPATLDFSDNSDQGYKYNPGDMKTPEYKAGEEPSGGDPGYKSAEPANPSPPEYNYSPAAGTPAPEYKSDEGKSEEPPEYKSGGEHTGDYRNYKKIEETYQEYQGR